MNSRDVILSRWHNDINNLERLNIWDAKELYFNIVNNKNNKDMDRLIKGTLYVIDDYIYKNKLYLFCSDIYSVDDMINSFCEVWIEKIREGVLLKYDNYSSIFNYSFYKDVCNKMGVLNINIFDYFRVSNEIFIDLFISYIEYKNINSDIEFNTIIDNYYKEHKNGLYYKKNSLELEIIFEKIYNNIRLLEYRNNKVKLAGFINLLLDNIMNDDIYDKVSYDMNIENEYIKKEMYNLLIKYIYGLLDRIELDSLNIVFGLDESSIDNYDYDKNNILRTEAKAIRKIRKSSRIREYYGIYN